MDKSVIETVYYIPDKIKKDGNFYHEFVGVGSTLPDNLESLLNELPDNINLNNLSNYIGENYDFKLMPTGEVILKDDELVKPYVAYKISQTSKVDKNAIIAENLKIIKEYYKYIGANELEEYNSCKKHSLNL